MIKRSLLRDHAPLFDRLLRLIDPLLAVVTGLVTYRIYLGDWAVPERYVLALIGAAVLCAALFPFLGLYTPRRGVSWFDEIRRLVNAWMLIAAAWFTFLFLSKSGTDFSRAWSTYWLVAGLGIHLAFRGTLQLLLYRLRQRGYNLRHIVIVGAGQLGQEIVQRLRKTTGSGFDIHGFYDDASNLQGQEVCGLPVLGDVDQTLKDLEQQSLDQVWIALPLRAEARISELLNGLRQHSVQVRFVPDIFNFTLLHHSMTEIAGLPVINLTDSPLQGGNVLLKHAEDFCLSAVFLLLISPLMLLIAMGIKMSSPGPVFYRQERITWNGERFWMLKFRSMPINVEASSGPVWAQADEGRATRFGAWLRRWSLDELPQFINVLRGQMSIVGPRPERPEFVERFKREIPGYMQKHLVKAGITGWAQVNDLRGNTDLGKRIQCDLYYIENWSVWFDLRIIALTVGHLFRSRNAY